MANPATAGTDHTVVGRSVFIAGGATSANIQVSASDDIFFDDNETYTVVISNPPAGWTIGDNTGVVTINDTTTVPVPLSSHGIPDLDWDDASGEGFDNSGETGDGGAGADGFDGERATIPSTALAATITSSVAAATTP